LAQLSFTQKSFINNIWRGFPAFKFLLLSNFKIIKFVSKNYLVLKEIATSKMAQNFVLSNNFS
jgi:hypothetical protein